MRRLFLLFLFCATIVLTVPFWKCSAQSAPAGDAPTSADAAPQEPGKADAAGVSGADAAEAPGEPDNKHVHVVRYMVAPHAEIELPKVAHESVLVCIRGEFTRSGENSPEESCYGGGALWGHGGAAYSVRNTVESRGEFVVVELKDSYASDQIYAPGSERDPVAADPRMFRVVLENEHVRLERLHLLPRQGTSESQYLMRLEIPLRPLHAAVAVTGGKSSDVTKAAGTATWHENDRMFSMVNLDEQDLELLILELKHPFCYGSGGQGFHSPPGTDPSMEAYVRKVYETVSKSWRKHMPREAREGEKGLVLVKFNILRDGTMPEDDILVEREFASETLLEKSLSALRQSGPFPPFPTAFEKPEITLRYSFYYSLPPPGPGCAVAP